MAIPEIVRILETSRVAPSSDSPKSANEFSLPLTYFDTFWFKFPPIQCLYFYQLTKSASTPSFFNSEILPRLKQSLSLALVHYLPLAGNLKWPSDASKPTILYAPNDGISLTVAESNVDNFHNLASNEMHKANELHPLVPELISSDVKAEIMSLQITLFPRQGFCIGTTTQHAVADGKTASMFMRSWAYLCKQGNIANPSLPPELSPYFDRSIIKDPAGLDLDFLNQWLAVSGQDQEYSYKRNLRIPQNSEAISDDVVRATFEFSPQDIKKLKDKALSKFDSGTGKLLHLSSFVVTLAYTATCLVKTKAGEGDDRLVVLDFGADCRTRLDPPVPTTYFGGCIMCFAASAKARDFMDDHGFAFVVGMVSDMVKRVKLEGVVEGAEKNISNYFGPKLPGLQLITVIGSPKLNLYGSDFGVGRIKKVKIVSMDGDEAVYISESRDGSGGVEISLALKKHEMENFASLFSEGLRKID